MARTSHHLNIEWLNFRNKSSLDYPFLVNITGYCDMRLPFETYNHVGRDDYYLIYLISGELSIDIDNIKRTVSKGDGLIIPPKCVYKYSASSPVYYLYAHFTGSYVADFLKECGFDNLPCVIENDFSVEIQSKFNTMIDAFLRGGRLSIQKCACLLQEILLNIFEKTLEKINDKSLNESLQYIHNFFTTKISIPHLASLENLSNSRYVTVFKKQMGKSPNEYIIELKLQLAKNMLDSTNMSIKQISEHIGYNDQYFFSRLFKKHLGISPQKYRSRQLH
ncbi:MAG: helix-turn-helix domain-containing protein [Clostridia bacterium]|nr:helix-turn-helix domain-containing protein [Clostridia bacterium]